MMKRIKYLVYTLASMAVLPSMAFASTSGGSAIAADIDIISTIQNFNDFLTGPVLLATATLFGVVAAFGIMKSKANDNRAYEWLGRIGIGVVCATAIGGLMQTLFGGATII